MIGRGKYGGPVDFVHGAVDDVTVFPSALTATYRFPMFYDAIRAAYPTMKIVATTPVTTRTPDVVDDHFYESPAWMNAHATEFDTASRVGPKIMVGEWASQEGTPS